MALETILSLDIGTSSVRAMLFDAAGDLIPGTSRQIAHEVRSSTEGEATLDANTLLRSASSQLLAAAKAATRPVAAVSICTFWHSVLGVDRAGEAITPIYLWSDTRCGEEVEILRAELDESAIHRRTGCLFHTSYLPARLLWLKRTNPDLFQAVARWISPGEYLVSKLIGEQGCSICMASGTGLLNQDRMEWDAELLSLLNLKKGQLAPLVEMGDTSWTAPQTIPGDPGKLSGSRWFPALGDGACSNVGTGGVRSDRVTLMAGTSGAVRVLGLPDSPPPPGLWKYRLDLRRSLIGGALSNGGAVYAWLRKTLQLPPPDLFEKRLGEAPPGAHGVTALPFLLGERSPDWFAHARGALLGLTASTSPEEIARACLEAVAFRFASVYERLQPLLPAKHEIIGTGAALSHSPAWAQIVADALNHPIRVAEEGEGSVRGAALMALEQLGLIQGIQETALPVGSLLLPRRDHAEVYRSERQRHEQIARGLFGSGQQGGGLEGFNPVV